MKRKEEGEKKKARLKIRRGKNLSPSLSLRATRKDWFEEHKAERKREKDKETEREREDV